jgi:hypothetical protein
MDSTEVKRKRRSKEDLDGRVFLCDCGKSYFSHQALYIHKKSKHPESITAEDLITRKRGRPKLIKDNQNDENTCQALPNSQKEKEKNAKVKKRRPGETCDEIFGEFLMKKQKRVSDEKYEELKKCIFSLRDCINQNPEKIDSNDFLRYDDYTMTEKAELIPNILNFYVDEYLPLHRPLFEKKKELHFLSEFCKWMKSRNYTQIELVDHFLSWV